LKTSSAPVTITSEIRPTGPNHVESFHIQHRIHEEDRLREKWIVRHAGRLGLDKACDELVDKYGTAAKKMLKKGTSAKPGSATARAYTEYGQQGPILQSRAQPSGSKTARAASVGGGQDMRKENAALRRENNALKKKLRNSDLSRRDFNLRPTQTEAIFPESRGKWYHKARKPISHPTGQTADPCNLPSSKCEVKRQRSAMARLSQPREPLMARGPQHRSKGASWREESLQGTSWREESSAGYHEVHSNRCLAWYK